MNPVVSLCLKASVSLNQELSKKLGSDYIVERKSVANKIKFINNDVQYATGICIYCGFDSNENNNVVVYGMSLFNHWGDYQIYNREFGYSDGRSFKTIDEVVLEIERVRDLVIKSDHN